MSKNLDLARECGAHFDHIGITLFSTTAQLDAFAERILSEAAVQVVIDYEPLFYFATHHNVSYNELCTAVRAAITKKPS